MCRLLLLDADFFKLNELKKETQRSVGADFCNMCPELGEMSET